MKHNPHEWTDRRRMMYIILSFSIVINLYGAFIHPDSSETSLISRICLSSLETISLMFSGYVLGRVAEKHTSLRGPNGSVNNTTETALGSSDLKEDVRVSKGE